MASKKKIDPKECPSYLNEFFTDQRVVKIKSERTIESYYVDLRIFLRYAKITKGGIDPNTPLDEITISDVPLEYVRDMTKLDIYNYLNYIATERKNTAKTRHRKLASLKVFYKFLHRDSGLIPSDPTKDVDYPKMHEHLPKYLTLDDSIKLLENMNSSDPYYYRDYCIITLFINCGMRLSELVGLNMQDVNLDERSMRLLGKGNKERIIHINDACASALVQYMSERQPSQSEPNALFLSKRGTRITNRRVQQIVDNALKDSNLDNQGYSTHKLRHTAATLMYQYGNVDTLILKEVLGHKSISTTEIYTHIANDSVKDAMDASPLANIQNNKKQSKRPKKTYRK
ncbi:MAG: tyrosine recombinase XerC [Oscillospiraceae bacterium]|nr:tyrosine recombinase XerC [Oscillospiraceae bacterium]